MYVRSQYDPTANPTCRLCGQDTETVTHLFWECAKTKAMIESYDSHMISTNDDYRAEWTMKSFIFSNRYRDITRPFNLASLYMRRYIWRIACLRGRLDVEEFIRSLKKQIETIKQAYPHHKRLSTLPEIVT